MLVAADLLLHTSVQQQPLSLFQVRAPILAARLVLRRCRRRASDAHRFDVGSRRLLRLVQKLLRVLLHDRDVVEDVHVSETVADDLLPDLARREIAAPVCSGVEFRELVELCLAEALRDALPHRSRVKLALRDHIVTGFVPHELVRGIVRVIRADIHPVPGDKRLCADRASVLLNGQIPAAEQNDVQPALLAEPLRGARRLRISAGHKANTGGLGAARNSE